MPYLDPFAVIARNQHRSIRTALLLTCVAGLLAGCGDETAAPTAPPTNVAAMPPVQVGTPAGDWRRLDDGSFLRSAAGAIGNRREADRCWPTDAGFDCLSLDAIPYPPKSIIVATRTMPDRYAEVPLAPAARGYSCAIYPSGVVEQRLIGAAGEWRRNDDSDASLWSQQDVAQLGDAGGYVDCRALATQLTSGGIGVLLSGDFARDLALPRT